MAKRDEIRNAAGRLFRERGFAFPSLDAVGELGSLRPRARDQ
ncbi:hypothetical protein [Paractinoplanes deccanensis]|nr:hypothetical protein [Actinoplanes deccanensis]